MCDFFINGFEKLVAVLIVLLGVAVLVGAFAGLRQEGLVAFLAILIGGSIYVVFLGGALYLGLGIYQNTKRTAELLEQQSK